MPPQTETLPASLQAFQTEPVRKRPASRSSGSLRFVLGSFFMPSKGHAYSKRLVRPIPSASRVRLGSFWVRFSELLLILNNFSGSFSILGPYRGGPTPAGPS